MRLGDIYTQSQEVFGGHYKVSDGCTMVAVNLKPQSHRAYDQVTT